MLTLFQEGGWSMFVILALGIAMLVVAGLFARKPERSKVDAIKALSAAVVFSVITGVMSDLATVGHAVASGKFADAPVYQIAFQGFAESLAPAILGMSLLMIAWLIVAVGLRQLRAVSPA